MGKKKCKKSSTGHKSLDWMLSAPTEEINAWIDQSAVEMAREKSSEELEGLTKDILEGKVRIGVHDGIIISKALKLKGINIDLYRRGKMKESPNCGSKNFKGSVSPAWTWGCLAGRGNYECPDFGAEGYTLS